MTWVQRYALFVGRKLALMKLSVDFAVEQYNNQLRFQYKNHVGSGYNIPEKKGILNKHKILHEINKLSGL